MKMYVREIVGRAHEHTEDGHYVATLSDAIGRKWGLAMGADGCSGYGGLNASHLALSVAGKYVEEHFLQEENKPKLLTDAVVLANQKLYSQNSIRTTLDVVLFSEEKCFSAHVGDSRIYLHKNNRLEQVTKDEVQFNEPANYLGVLEIEGRSMAQRVSIGEHDLRGVKGIFLVTDGLASRVSEEEVMAEFQFDDYTIPLDVLFKLEELVRVPCRKLEILSEMKRGELGNLLAKRGYTADDFVKTVRKAYAAKVQEVVEYVDGLFKFDDATMIYVDLGDVVKKSYGALRTLQEVRVPELVTDVAERNVKILGLEGEVEKKGALIETLQRGTEEWVRKYGVLEQEKKDVDKKYGILEIKLNESEEKVRVLESEKKEREGKDGKLNKVVHTVLKIWEKM